MHGSISKIRNRRLFPGEAVYFISDILWYVRSHSPGTAFLSPNEAK